MAIVTRYLTSGQEAVYDEYASCYKRYSELPKTELNKCRHHRKRIENSLMSLDKKFAEFGEQ